MGEANKRGTFEQRKNNPKTMTENQPKPMDLEDAQMKIGNAVNECLLGRVPIPFILSILVLINHDLSSKHIERANAMQKLAEQAKKDNVVKIEERATDVSSN